MPASYKDHWWRMDNRAGRPCWLEGQGSRLCLFKVRGVGPVAVGACLGPGWCPESQAEEQLIVGQMGQMVLWVNMVGGNVFF